ncbi:hypothetical protein G3N57_28275 [Paraburkholderia sp. Se-20369]|nr:hypothetical protein [Paraburkholderia sp. Se-20369]
MKSCGRNGEIIRPARFCVDLRAVAVSTRAMPAPRDGIASSASSGDASPIRLSVKFSMLDGFPWSERMGRDSEALCQEDRQECHDRNEPAHMIQIEVHFK